MREIEMKVMEFDNEGIESFQDFCEFIKKFISGYLDSVDKIDMDPMYFFCHSPNTMYFINPLQFSAEDKLLNLLSVKRFCQDHGIDYLGAVVTAEMRVAELPNISEAEFAMHYQTIKEFFEPVDIIWVQCLNFKNKETMGFGWKFGEDGIEPCEISKDAQLGTECTFHRVFFGEEEILH